MLMLHSRDIHFGNPLSNGIRVNSSEVDEHHHCGLIIDVARDESSEPLPVALMANDSLAADILDKPSEAVMAGVWYAVCKFHRCPHFLQARSL